MYTISLIKLKFYFFFLVSEKKNIPILSFKMPVCLMSIIYNVHVHVWYFNLHVQLLYCFFKNIHFIISFSDHKKKTPCFLFLKCLSCMFIILSAHVWNFDTNNDQLDCYMTLTGSFWASIITSVEQFLSWPGPAARAHQHVCRLLPRSLLLSLSPGEISNVNFREN